MLEGPVIKSILTLSIPLFISNLLQQFYNIADTIIVGRFIGPNALAAVGSSFTLDMKSIKEISNFSIMTSIQQSVINFGILMIQGLVNSFGASTMAAFAAGVKIDAFAYMPVQDFGNAFSIFVAQNFWSGLLFKN